MRMTEVCRRTVIVPLATPTTNKSGRINWAMKEFFRARKYACDYYNNHTPSDVTRSDRSDLYQKIRSKHDVEIPANVVSQAVTIVHQNYRQYERGDTESPPRPSHADIYGLHSQIARLFYESGTYYLNMETGRGRVSLPLVVSDSDYHRSRLPYPDSIPDMTSKYQRIPGVCLVDIDESDLPADTLRYSSSTLHRNSDNEYYFHLIYRKEAPRSPAASDARYVVGVDRGRNQLAYAALYDRKANHVIDWWNRGGGEVEHYMEQLTERIRDFKRSGVWSEMDDARARRFRYKEQIDYEIANAVANLAQSVDDGDAIIALEELSGMSRLGSYPAENRRFSQWSYYRLAEFIRQKAEEIGIGVTEVNPRYTSQKCSRCGSDETKRNSIYFECTNCDYQQHADANAAVNIAKEA